MPFASRQTKYGSRLQAALPPEPPPIPRLRISVIGQGVAAYGDPLFRKLRAHGVYFARVNPENGLKGLLDTVDARARSQPAPYGHWYIDAGEPAIHDAAITCTSYKSLEPLRVALLRKIDAETRRPGRDRRP